jgi:hypothetical protein
LAVTLVVLFAASKVGLAQTVNEDDTQKGTVEGWIADKYDCQLIKPMIAQSDNSPSRVGAIINGFYEDVSVGKFVDYRISRAQQICVPDYAVSDPTIVSASGTYDTQSYAYSKGASLTLKAQIGNYFNLANLNLGYIDQVELSVEEAKLYSILSKGRFRSASDIAKYDYCKATLKDLARQKNYISNPQLIIGTCVGKVNLKLLFSKAVSGEVLSLQISALKLGVSLDWHETMGTEVACPSGQTSKTAGAATDTAKAANIDQLNKKMAADVAKAFSDYLSKVASVTNDKAATATKNNAPDAEKKKKEADDAKKSADAAKQDLSKNNLPTSVAGKCYSGVTLVSANPVIFGVQLMRAKPFLPSVSAR